MTAKFIFDNGIMKLNPAYNNGGQQPTAPGTPQPLTIVSSIDDIIERGFELPPTIVKTLETLQDSAYLSKLNVSQDYDIICNLTRYFEMYKIPLGLVNKLLALTNYKLNFIIDDSGSMAIDYDAPIRQAHPCTKQTRDPNNNRAQANALMTRWEEAEDRLHILLDMLAFIPTQGITLSFLNRADSVEITRQGMTPERFAETAHQRIRDLFKRDPAGRTPIHGKLSKAFTESTGNTMHYLLTDGEPTDATAEKVGKLILKRRNPQANPLTFLSCTNDDIEVVDWMFRIENEAPFTVALDDYATEKQEVVYGHGPVFPFTKGMWLICNLVAAINPDDLDALDEPTPFTKGTLDDLLGRKYTEEEYRHYFDHHPEAAQYRALYNQFAREDITARQVIASQAQPSILGSASQFAHENITARQVTANRTQPSILESASQSTIDEPAPFEIDYAKQLIIPEIR